MTDSISRPLLLVAAFLAVVSNTLFDAGAQTLIDGGDRSAFLSIGIDGDETILVAGDSDGTPVLFRLAGTSFESTPLPVLPLTETLDFTRMSRDGRYIVATDRSSYAILLWSVTNLSVVTPIQQTNAEARITSTDVTSTPDGPLVLGVAEEGSFTWTPVRGFRYWLNSYEPPFRINYLNRMSADGTKFVGQERALVGTNIVQRPILATADGYSLLDMRNGTQGLAYSISPDGSLLGGHIDLESVIWEDGKIRRLAFAEDIPHAALEIADSGWTLGGSNAGSLIYNTRGKKLQRFDDWWASEFPQVPLPIAGTRVQDFHEHQGNLYFLLRHFGTYSYRSFLAIVPLSALKHGK